MAIFQVNGNGTRETENTFFLPLGFEENLRYICTIAIHMLQGSVKNKWELLYIRQSITNIGPFCLNL